MKLAIGSDHAGYDVKEEVIEKLTSEGYHVKDFGTYSHDRVDYPDIAHAVAEAVASGEYDRGILLCGTGIGMSIAANKVRGVRAALCHDDFTAQMAREHNDANIMAAGVRTTATFTIMRMIDIFLSTEFAGGRHTNRVSKIEKA